MTLPAAAQITEKVTQIFAGGPRPRRDWRALLVVAAVLLCAIVLWQVRFFQTVVEGNSVGGMVLPTTVPAAPDPLAPVRTLYERRAHEEVRYTSGAYEYSDPSL